MFLAVSAFGGTRFSLWGLEFAWPKPHRLKPVLLKPTSNLEYFWLTEDAGATAGMRRCPPVPGPRRPWRYTAASLPWACGCSERALQTGQDRGRSAVRSSLNLVLRGRGIGS